MPVCVPGATSVSGSVPGYVVVGTAVPVCVPVGAGVSTIVSVCVCVGAGVGAAVFPAVSSDDVGANGDGAGSSSSFLFMSGG